MNNSEKIQTSHYDRIFNDYENHYDDYWSQQYRKIFFYRKLFSGLDLSNVIVLEAMCGSGQATNFLVNRGAKVIGLDISSNMVESFGRRHPGVDVINSSVLDIDLEDSSVDGVIIIGGLHHVHPHVFEAINEIHRVLKPSGFFCFCEPHKNSIFDKFRKLWYRFDKNFFESNEESVDIESLKNKFNHKFNFEIEKYGGGPAYLFVYNSLIFRLPIFLKTLYSWFLFLIDFFIQPIMKPKTSMFVLCRWRKKDL